MQYDFYLNQIQNIGGRVNVAGNLYRTTDPNFLALNVGICSGNPMCSGVDTFGDVLAGSLTASSLVPFDYGPGCLGTYIRTGEGPHSDLTKENTLSGTSPHPTLSSIAGNGLHVLMCLLDVKQG